MSFVNKLFLDFRLQLHLYSYHSAHCHSNLSSKSHLLPTSLLLCIPFFLLSPLCFILTIAKTALAWSQLTSNSQFNDHLSSSAYLTTCQYLIQLTVLNKLCSWHLWYRLLSLPYRLLLLCLSLSIVSFHSVGIWISTPPYGHTLPM